MSSSTQMRGDWLQSIGPVQNLESYVKADWWRHIFNANYLRTDGDVVEDNRLTANEVDLFTHITNAGKDQAILDLCCGQGRHVLEFARRGYQHLTGLDRSHYLVNRARNIARREGLGVTLREGDARKFNLPTDNYDLVYIAGNSFGYFESAQDDELVLNEVQRVLKPFGTLLLDLTDGDFMRSNFQARSWEWIDNKYFVCRERSLSSDNRRLVSREVITHVKKGVVADQFYAERLYSPGDIQQLLEKVGFTGVEFHHQLVTDSSRNQDLGMMAQRIIITGTIKKDWSPKKQPGKDVTQVVVVLGDPRKADLVKPDATFDEDDYHTIDVLKKALAQQEGFRFSFLDNHETLIRDLQTLKVEPDLVFNLCDEGFQNEPTFELHVPAILEMLGKPYTGGNPQCLAYCYDKSLVRGIALEDGLPVPSAYIVKPEDTQFIELSLDFPVIVKPNYGDSSIGISQDNVCYTINELEAAILSVRERVGYNKPVLVEEFLTGKDISVGIVGNPLEQYRVLPIIAEDYSDLPEGLPHICGYEAKWDPESPYFKSIRSVPADLPEETERYLIASCLQLFQRLGCRDYARFDWRLDSKGTPRLLEANPNPGWCWDGHLAKMAALADISYEELLGLILKTALARKNGA